MGREGDSPDAGSSEDQEPEGVAPGAPLDEHLEVVVVSLVPAALDGEVIPGDLVGMNLLEGSRATSEPSCPG